MPTPTLGMQKTPSYPEKLFFFKKSQTSAQVITNCAFMPTVADTVKIHVQAWKGPAEAWMRGTDRDFVGLRSTIYKKNVKCLWVNRAVCVTRPLVQPKLFYRFIKTFQGKKLCSLIVLSELCV